MGATRRRPATLRAVHALHTLLLALVWIAAAILIALGAAGIVASMNHLPVTPARTEAHAGPAIGPPSPR